MIFASFLFLPGRKKYSVYNETYSEFLNFFKGGIEMKKREKLKNWCVDHIVELAYGTTVIITGGITGYCGYFYGVHHGYCEALTDTANIVPSMVDIAGREGCFALVDVLKEKVPEAHKMLNDYCCSSSEAGLDAYTRFYNALPVQEILEDWKKFEKK